jgi:predicted nuclease of restriction endonuclease-like (RecB) superfamily
MKKSIGHSYKTLLGDIKARIRNAQYEALRAVNKELISLYWDIGRIIVSRQRGRSWGRAIVQKLARDLQLEFPGMMGFSSSGLWRMRTLYLSYSKDAKLAPMVREIAWTHNCIILEQCKSSLEREFYIRMTRKMGWTKNVLTHHIENRTYEKTLLNQTNFNKTLPEKIKNQAKLAIKDEYSFDFLELTEDHSEMELERALMAKINRFLIEMGGVFSFMGNQFRLEINGNEFFVDILLYHRKLKCLVAIELKVGLFRPEHAGKMQFYLAALDDRVKMAEENPSIGIILCKSKDETVVEYALKNTQKPIGVATYRIVSILPKELRGQLPGPNQVKKLLSGL